MGKVLKKVRSAGLPLRFMKKACTCKKFHLQAQAFLFVILNTKKIKEKICAEIAYKPVFNSYKIVGLIFSKF